MIRLAVHFAGKTAVSVEFSKAVGISSHQYWKSTILIIVTAAIIIENGCVFAARRKPGLHLAGYWEFPGGKVELGETPEQCLERELKEELGINCKIGAFLGESVFNYGNKIIRLLGFYTTHVHGTFLLRDHDQMVWLHPIELSELQWAPADIPLVELLIRKITDGSLTASPVKTKE